MSFCDEDNSYGDCLVVPGRLNAIDAMAAYVRDFLGRGEFDAHRERTLVLILEELITNSVSHGGAGADSNITIGLRADGDKLRILYCDEGTAFNPHTDLPAIDTHKPTAERRTGGLGWPLIWHYCESIDYRREGDANRLELTLNVGSES